MDTKKPTEPVLGAAEALMVAGAGLAYAGCSSDSGGGGGAGGFTGVIPTQPAAPATATEETASRFLQQTTFGPTTAAIDEVVRLGFDGWFTEQARTGRTVHLAYMGRDEDDRVNGWFRIALSARDQLRQRMAFALSQILVVSDADIDDARGLANYYDILCEHAFGNYRDLLEAVSLSPVMGTYLSSIRNEKADPVQNIRPDENYAREIMQLFTIGLFELNNDGTARLDGGGQPIETYTQADIEGMAQVFTGWNHANLRDWRDRDEDFIRPMQNYEAFHDLAPKTIVGGVTLPAGQTAIQDLGDALDTLFNHPNVGPFIAYRLIQRFTTSNPSPAYVDRVATVFNSDFQGVRGNLLAVLRAILFDTENLNGPTTDPTEYGKLKEPLLRQTAIWRAFSAAPLSFLRFEYTNIDRDLGQAPLRSPSVFNFYPPDYSQPGAVATAGLVSPEFALLNATFVTETTNRFYDDTIRRYSGASGLSGDIVRININFERTLADTPAALVDHLNLLLMAGQMSTAMRQTVIDLVTDTSNADDGSDRVTEAIYIIVTSPEFSVQR